MHEEVGELRPVIYRGSSIDTPVAAQTERDPRGTGQLVAPI